MDFEQFKSVIEMKRIFSLSRIKPFVILIAIFMWVSPSLSLSLSLYFCLSASKRQLKTLIDLLSGVRNMSVLINFQRHCFTSNAQRENEANREICVWVCGKQLQFHSWNTCEKYFGINSRSRCLVFNSELNLVFGPIVYRIIGNLFYKLNFNSNLIDFVYLLNWFHTHVRTFDSFDPRICIGSSHSTT